MLAKTSLFFHVLATRMGCGKDNVIATYGGYRVHLYSNDSVIKMATVPNVGEASVMGYAADRAN